MVPVVYIYCRTLASAPCERGYYHIAEVRLHFGQAGADHALDDLARRFVTGSRFVDRNAIVTIDQDTGVTVLFLDLPQVEMLAGPLARKPAPRAVIHRKCAVDGGG